MSESSKSSSGTSIFGLLGVAFVVLKLTGYIDWSWWWVTAPFWGGLAFVMACLVVALACFLIYLLILLIAEFLTSKRHH